MAYGGDGLPTRQLVAAWCSLGPIWTQVGSAGSWSTPVRETTAPAWWLSCYHAVVLVGAYSAVGERQRLVTTRAGDAGRSAVALSTLAFLKLCAGFSPLLLPLLLELVSRCRGLRG